MSTFISAVSTRPRTVMGIDNSTNSMAYTIFTDGEPVKWGEFVFRGANTFERIADARHVLTASLPLFEEIREIGIEKTTRVNSQQTAIYLAMAAGVVISHFSHRAKVREVPAPTWMSKTSKPILSKVEKQALKLTYPGKSDSWYRNKAREESKLRTIQWIKNVYGLDMRNDNVADSFCIAAYLANNPL